MTGFFGVLGQYVALEIDSKQGEDQIRERLAAREINREMLRLGLDELEEHEKRKGMMRLTDDGELEEVVDDREEVLVPIQQNRKG